MQAPCETWPVSWPCDVSCLSPTVTGDAVEVASAVVWALSGRQFGLCEVTLRPCRRTCYGAPWPRGWSEWAGWSGGWPTPVLHGGRWFNVACGACGDGCSCSALEEVVLPGRVHDVTRVTVDGTPLVTGAYRVDDNRVLVRVDGGRWPECNDLTLADTQPGTWSVAARYGEVPPAGGDWAVGELACELAKAMVGEDCRLPRNVSQLVRQGVTISFPDVTEMLRQRRTGLYLTDLFIETYNPHHLVRRAKTYGVDTPRARRVGT